MPTSPNALLERLDLISTSVANSGNGLAVIGLGSVGIESAKAILAFLDKHFEVNEAIRMEIEEMCKQAFHNRT